MKLRATIIGLAAVGLLAAVLELACIAAERVAGQPSTAASAADGRSERLEPDVPSAFELGDDGGRETPELTR
jgi:hypothetical protein